MRTRCRLTACAVVGLCLLSIARLAADDGAYPLIKHTGISDGRYRQHQESVREYYVASRSNRQLPPLTIFRYHHTDNDTLITVASRFTLPYSSLATLNRIAHAEIPADTDYLLVPSIPGIFVPETPHNDLERLLHELRVNDEAEERRYKSVIVTVRGEQHRFRFYPGGDFDRVERLAFLNILFRRPVGNVRISSPYGYRDSPFGGPRGFHSGVDFAAPKGTAVYAARDGTVAAAGFDPVFGNFVLLRHQGGFETFYGHLHEIFVRLNDTVGSGMMIGTVGNSGLSTGPHLHFEIRLHGETRDPARHMPGLQR